MQDNSGTIEAQVVTPESSEHAQWDQILDRFDCLRGRERRVEELTGGHTNKNIKVTTDDLCAVARITQESTGILGIDREAERFNTLAAAESGVGAPVLEYVTDPPLLLIEYIESKTLDLDDLKSGEPLKRIADACRTLHAGPRFINDFNAFDLTRHYLRAIDERGIQLPPGYLDHLPDMDAIEKAFHALSIQTVPCHNDLLAFNFLDDGEKIWIIDYEFAGNNDPLFEIGNIWSDNQLSVEQLDQLMEAYDGRIVPSRVARARLQGLMSKCVWTLYTVIQGSMSDIEFDFDAWGEEKWDRALAEFRGPDFGRLLEASQLSM
jgi:thiamine kinase-like enzyme